MDSKIKIGLLGAVIAWALSFFCYTLGYDKAQAEGNLALEELKLAQAQAVIDAQNEVKLQYETQIKNLNVALAAARSDSADRLRQLETFRRSDTDLATCTRERNELAGLAVRGEELLNRADSYLEALK